MAGNCLRSNPRTVTLDGRRTSGRRGHGSPLPAGWCLSVMSITAKTTALQGSASCTFVVTAPLRTVLYTTVMDLALPALRSSSLEPAMAETGPTSATAGRFSGVSSWSVPRPNHLACFSKVEGDPKEVANHSGPNSASFSSVLILRHQSVG